MKVGARFDRQCLLNCAFLMLLYLLNCTSLALSDVKPLNDTERASAEEHMKMQIEIVERLLDGYDKRFIPSPPGRPLHVEFKISISDVLVLDDDKMESDMLIFIKQVWYDYRLSWGNGTERIKVREHFLDKIWMPDTRMSNLKELNRFDGFGGINMNLHSNGKVYFSQLALVKLSCPMDLRDFPMDKQTCFLNFSSYAYGITAMVYFLSQKKIDVRQVHLPQFDFLKVEVVNHPAGTTKLPKVTVGIVFKRRVGYYLLQIYIPTIFLVVLSWLSFLMEPTNIADRLSLEVTMILSIVFLLGGINTTIPKVSYPKASDWFMVSSFLFIFFNLLETMLVFRMTSEKTTRPKEALMATSVRKYLSSVSGVFHNMKTTATQNGETTTTITAEDEEPATTATSECTPIRKKKPVKKRCHMFWVDKICLLVFPSAYFGFNVAYWVRYMS